MLSAIYQQAATTRIVLRRHAQGILRILIEKKIDLDIEDFLKRVYEIDDQTYATFLKKNTTFGKDDFFKNIFAFLDNRLKTTLREYEIDGQLIESGLQLKNRNTYDLHCQLLALKECMKENYFAEFTFVYRRVINILKKNISFFKRTLYG